MTVITALEDRGGMRFNNRRLSRDRVVTADLLQTARNHRLLYYPCSEDLFENPSDCGTAPDKEAGPVLVESADALSEAGPDDYVFLEDRNPDSSSGVSSCVLYLWNRRYPADLYFTFDYHAMKLTEQCDFPGFSHEKVTKEVYVK